MKKLLGIIVLSLLLSVASKADDISNFEIEEMSIGDSLLDYFNKDTIDNNKPIYYKDNKFSTFELSPYKNAKIYDGVQVVYLTEDKTLKIYSISGVLSCENSFHDCKKKWKKILSDLTNNFKETTTINDKGTYSHMADKTGNSIQYHVDFEFKNGDRISLEMVNWTEEMQFIDNLRINIDTKKFVKWLNTKAWK